ncbi:MAG: hypothetical protein WC837_04465 [Bellilinea sp.]
MRVPVLEMDLTMDWLEIEPNTTLYVAEKTMLISDPPPSLFYPLRPLVISVRLNAHRMDDGTWYLLGSHFVQRGGERLKRVLISRIDENEKHVG